MSLIIFLLFVILVGILCICMRQSNTCIMKEKFSSSSDSNSNSDSNSSKSIQNPSILYKMTEKSTGFF